MQQKAMHQDAYHHVRELEMRLGGILAGEHARTSPLSPNFVAAELSRSAAGSDAQPAHAAADLPRRRRRRRATAHDDGGRLSIRADARVPHDDATVAPPALPASVTELYGRSATVAMVTLICAVALLAGYVLYRTVLLERKIAAAAQSAADARDLLEQELAPRAARTEVALGDAIASAAEAKRMVSVMAAPDARRVALIGGAAARAAVGQAMWSRSRGVLITADHVPRATGGTVYQVWMDTSQGPLSLGFIMPDAQGRAAATFEIPPQVSGTILGFLLTREPAGGSTAPRGAVVLSN